MRKLQRWIHRHPLKVALLTLALLFWGTHGFLNWRMERRWQAYREEARQRGVALDMAEIIPPKIPDEENFASTPLLAKAFGAGGTNWDPFSLRSFRSSRGKKLPPWGDRIKGEEFDWTTWRDFFVTVGWISEPSAEPARDVLFALDHLAPQIAEWRQAAARPHSRFPIDYEAGLELSLPHLSLLQGAAQFFGLRMRAHLAVDDSAAAYEDFRDAFQAYRAIAEEPTLISGLVRMSIFAIICARVGDGLAEHRWGESELRRIENELATIRPLRDYTFALSSERTFANEIYDQLAESSPIKRAALLATFAGAPRPLPAALNSTLVRMLLPKRMFRENELRTNRYIDELLARVDARAPRIEFDRTTPSSPWSSKTFSDVFFIPFGIMSSGYGSIEDRYLQFQTRIDQTRIACALERCWLARSKYPETLADLASDFVGAVPEDLYAAAPMKYRRVGDSSFRLYSVGKNRVDDGGIINPNKTEQKQLDAIWLYAPPERAEP